eukprot:GEZU01027678.1.p2 GENE.GEZU01027678.1~~GEZU01027678.1.p2  ORF type:complete len:161 (-),score=29.47 GEZU01027678.1:201-683(-)
MLAEASVELSSLNGYLGELRAFWKWARDNNFVFITSECFEEYVAHLWQEGYAFSKVGKAHAAMKLYCEINNLDFEFSPRTERIVSGYRKLDKIKRKRLQRPPIKRQLLAHIYNKAPNLEFKAALITTFYSLLRCPKSTQSSPNSPTPDHQTQTPTTLYSR